MTFPNLALIIAEFMAPICETFSCPKKKSDFRTKQSLAYVTALDFLNKKSFPLPSAESLQWPILRYLNSKPLANSRT
ncbi:hypothetical protein F4805DRAFT_221224 [Annulohypoxylon moriforme]|nr:hypothetical protein F4805DRAFT_221224 [Annulohypoxylon moriforme]